MLFLLFPLQKIIWRDKKLKIFIELDTEKNSLNETLDFIKKLYNGNISNINQSTLPNNNSNNTDSNIVSIVVRDGETNKTVDVKETLKELGFNYYAKTKSGKQDPRWTQTTDVEHWNNIKDNQVFNGLNIWTSGGD